MKRTGLLLYQHAQKGQTQHVGRPAVAIDESRQRQPARALPHHPPAAHNTQHKTPRKAHLTEGPHQRGPVRVLPQHRGVAHDAQQRLGARHGDVEAPRGAEEADEARLLLPAAQRALQRARAGISAGTKSDWR